MRRIALSRPVPVAMLAALIVVLIGAAPSRAAAPAATIEGPDAAVTGSPVGFDASKSSDPDGDALRYRWAIDGKAVSIDDGWLALSFAHPGRHTVTVTVTDAAGESSIAQHLVVVTGEDRSDSSVAPIGSTILDGVSAIPELTVRPAPVRLREDRLRVVLRCRGAARCAGFLRAVALVGATERPVLLASRRFAVRRGAPRIMRLALDRRARQQLGRHPRVRVTAYRGRVRVAAIWATYAYRVG